MQEAWDTPPASPGLPFRLSPALHAAPLTTQQTLYVPQIVLGQSLKGQHVWKVF